MSQISMHGWFWKSYFWGEIILICDFNFGQFGWFWFLILSYFWVLKLRKCHRGKWFSSLIHRIGIPTVKLHYHHWESIQGSYHLLNDLICANFLIWFYFYFDPNRDFKSLIFDFDFGARNWDFWFWFFDFEKKNVMKCKVMNTCLVLISVKGAVQWCKCKCHFIKSKKGEINIFSEFRWTSKENSPSSQLIFCIILVITILIYFVTSIHAHLAVSSRIAATLLHNSLFT